MTVQLIPWAQKIVSDYLREHEDLQALQARVVSKTPADRDSTPWVRVTELDATQAPGSTTDHLTAFFMQFDCYATDDGGLPEAALLGRTVRAVLLTAPDADHEGAVVSAVRIDGYSRIPDTGPFEPARERIIVSATVWAHP